MIENSLNIWIALGRVEIIYIPDITEVCYGRKVGWGIRRIPLPEEIESISGTKIRKDLLT